MVEPRPGAEGRRERALGRRRRRHHQRPRRRRPAARRSGNDKLLGGDGNDLLKGDGDSNPDNFPDDDTLQGDGGNDTLEGDEGSDTLIGSAGTDTASYEDHIANIIATLDGAKNDGSPTLNEVDWTRATSRTWWAAGNDSLPGRGASTASTA